MTRIEAFEKAVKLWGRDAVAGRNFNYNKQCHVGIQIDGVWAKRGVGHTFEEAFDSVVDYPDGKLPVTHGPRHNPDR